MRLHRCIDVFLGTLLASQISLNGVEANLCLMVYQMADNDLGPFLRQDFVELSNAPAMSSLNLRTWVYYDALNQGGVTLPGTVYRNGDDASTTFTGSRYVTYDSSLGRMTVDTELPGETDSDSESTVQRFLEHALKDCLANGYDSLMAVFASHGASFVGFGGDYNVRTRKLLQSNKALANAIQSALRNTVGAPKKLEVLGFDACSMQSVEVVDDYVDVANYILASEALEPGHGTLLGSVSS
jgi:Clostripain family